jgi:hypothetical protein
VNYFATEPRQRRSSARASGWLAGWVSRSLRCRRRARRDCRRRSSPPLPSTQRSSRSSSTVTSTHARAFSGAARLCAGAEGRRRVTRGCTRAARHLAGQLTVYLQSFPWDVVVLAWPWCCRVGSCGVVRGNPSCRRRCLSPGTRRSSALATSARAASPPPRSSLSPWVCGRARRCVRTVLSLSLRGRVPHA